MTRAGFQSRADDASMRIAAVLCKLPRSNLTVSHPKVNNNAIYSWKIDADIHRWESEQEPHEEKENALSRGGKYTGRRDVYAAL